MIQDMDEFTIPYKYNPVLNHFRNKGELSYLNFDGTNFSVPIEKIAVLYEDLKSKLPKGELARKAILRMGAFWSEWTSSVEEEPLDLSDARKEMTRERMEAIIMEEEKLQIPVVPENEVKKKEFDWKTLGIIILVILAILAILAIIIVVIAGDGDLDLDLPNIDWSDIDLSGWEPGMFLSGIGGSSNSEDKRRMR